VNYPRILETSFWLTANKHNYSVERSTEYNTERSGLTPRLTAQPPHAIPFNPLYLSLCHVVPLIKTSKSTQAHDAVAAASSSIIRLSTLVRAPSSSSMARPCSWQPTLLMKRFYFWESFGESSLVSSRAPNGCISEHVIQASQCRPSESNLQIG